MILRSPGLRFDPNFPLSRSELDALFTAVCDAVGADAEEIDLHLVDDRGIAELNAEFLGLSGPTNILSFPAGAEGPAGADDDDGAQEGPALGELALSVGTLAREAFLYGQDPAEHTARLLAHGVLHLLGLDHGPEMEALTDHAVAAACAAC